MRVGVVVIGRNEGERLARCLASIGAPAGAVVYVDSGSSDGSVERARAAGASVVELDPALPFTAARARNAGFERLAGEVADLDLVQFVDGDCELQAGWLEDAARHLETHSEVAAVCGRRRERHPGDSPYNRLADLEWDTPVGDARAFGGDVMLRASVLREVGGYDASLIAGEDPELAHRIRRAGHRVERLDREMTLHDAALRRFGQWWTRQVRAGHAFAEALHRQLPSPERETLRHVVSSFFWAGAVPLLALGLAPWLGPWAALVLAAPVLLWVRIYHGRRGAGAPARDAALYASGLALAKPAELQGALRFAWNRLAQRRATPLIEYK